MQYTVPAESLIIGVADSVTFNVTLCAAIFKVIPNTFGTDGVMFSVGRDDGVEDGKLIIVGVKLGLDVLVGFKVSPRFVGLEVVGAWVGREVGCPVGCLVGCPVG
jgi:hypothetical protein